MSRLGKLSVVLCFATAVAIVAAAAEKKRDWQMGKVLDSDRSSYFAGTVGNANTTGTAQANGNTGTYQGHTNASQIAVYTVYQKFLIEGETHAYLAQELLRWRWSKPANLTVNGPVKFAIEKRKLFVIDEDGKELDGDHQEGSAGEAGTAQTSAGVASCFPLPSSGEQLAFLSCMNAVERRRITFLRTSYWPSRLPSVSTG